MKKHRIALTTLAAATALWASSASAQMNTDTGSYTQQLEGDTASACEAVLCLAGGGGPSECVPSLTKYFSIWDKKPWKTIEKRINFLNLCPSSNSSAQMQTLVNAIGHGAGKCDAASLNISNTVYLGEGESYISDQMPSYCSAYINHDFVDVKALTPTYVGEPMNGGHWVDPQGGDSFVTTFPSGPDMNNLDGKNNTTAEAQSFQAAANEQSANASGFENSLSSYQNASNTSAYSGDSTDYLGQMQNENVDGSQHNSTTADQNQQAYNSAQTETQSSANSYDSSLTNFNNLMNAYGSQGKP